MGFSTEVSRAGSGSGRAPKFSLSVSFLDTRTFYTNLAGVPGFEPGLSVLETDVLTVDTIPLGRGDQLKVTGNKKSLNARRLSPVIYYLLRLFMIRVLTATSAKLTELQTIRGCLLVLCRDVVAAFAIRALKYNVVARHNSKSPITNLKFQISNLRSEVLKLYSTTS